jgi:hypothetical protein
MMNSGVLTVADAARLIAPKNTPPWLLELLRVYGLETTKERELQEQLPSKANMRKKLLEAKQAVGSNTALSQRNKFMFLPLTAK